MSVQMGEILDLINRLATSGTSLPGLVPGLPIGMIPAAAAASQAPGPTEQILAGRGYPSQAERGYPPQAGRGYPNQGEALHQHPDWVYHLSEHQLQVRSQVHNLTRLVAM